MAAQISIQSLCRVLLLFVLVLFLFWIPLTAQNQYELKIIQVEDSPIDLQKIEKFQSAFSDSTLLISELTKLIQSFHNQSYFEASIDSIIWEENLASAFLHVGQVYQWSRLKAGDKAVDFAGQSGFREKYRPGKLINHREFLLLQDRLLRVAENNGYPFAAVYIDSIDIDSGKVSAILEIETGRLIKYDSLIVEGDAGISESYLRSYLGIKKGETFSRKRILKISDRIRELPYVRETQNSAVTFWEDLASVHIYLEKKKASRFDFLLGVLPDNRRMTNKLILTGTFLAAMQNQFGMGEHLSVSFERLRPQTQKLEVTTNFPYLFDLPFGMEGRFYQYRRDSTYTDIKGRLGVQYIIDGGTYLKAFSKTESSNLIAVDTISLKQGKAPRQLDVNTNLFGLEGNWQQLDYRLNPRNGWNINLSAGVGFRKIKKNQIVQKAIPEFYSSLGGKSLQITFDGYLEKYFPVLQNSTIKLALNGATLMSKEAIYQNEQYRIGGNSRLRGFDEESIFANSYAIGTMEYRLLAGQNSYFYLFGDYAVIKIKAVDSDHRVENFLGLGAGLTFETTAGIFALSVAVGKPENIGIDFRNPKVHFGYVTYF